MNSVLENHKYTGDFATDFKEVCNKLNVIPNTRILNSFRLDSPISSGSDLGVAPCGEISVKGLDLDSGTIRALCVVSKANSQIGKIMYDYAIICT